MRAKIDTRQGLWPAFWTLGVYGEWPSGGEIDIMEYYKSTVLANVAWGKHTRWVAMWDDSRTGLYEFDDPEWGEKFHVWRMDWDEDEIVLSVDGRILNTTDLSKTINPTDRGPENPFRSPHYIILNLAIGGTAGGNPSHTEFPARYVVDYVRIYQKK